MGFLDKILKGFLGDKNEKDVRELRKYVEQVLNAEKEKIEQLSTDELRAKTEEFRSRIREATTAQDKEISDLLIPNLHFGQQKLGGNTGSPASSINNGKVGRPSKPNSDNENTIASYERSSNEIKEL